MTQSVETAELPCSALPLVAAECSTPCMFHLLELRQAQERNPRATSAASSKERSAVRVGLGLIGSAALSHPAPSALPGLPERGAGVDAGNTCFQGARSTTVVRGDRGHASRDGSAPRPAGLTDEVSGSFASCTGTAVPAPAPWWNAGQRAGYTHLMGAPMRRWGWCFKNPASSGGQTLRTCALIVGCLGLQAELRVYRARMALSMWTTRKDNLWSFYTLSRLFSLVRKDRQR